MTKFDPMMKQHVSSTESRAGSRIHYLDKNIQNELMDSISSKILATIVKEIKASKYLSIISDCTPVLSQKEQLSVKVRIMIKTLEDIPQVKEHPVFC